jgi:putative PIN family toxin of toxin-antitoxin system
MVSATLDVNVLVSAAISPRGNPHRVLQAWYAGGYDVVTSEQIITQLTIKLRSDKIGRRFGLTTAGIRTFTAPLRSDARLVIVTAGDILPVTGDLEDDVVLATARLGEVDYLVTGDHGLLARSPYEGIEIVNPRTFLERLDGGGA